MLATSTYRALSRSSPATVRNTTKVARFSTTLPVRPGLHTRAYASDTGPSRSASSQVPPKPQSEGTSGARPVSETASEHDTVYNKVQPELVDDLMNVMKAAVTIKDLFGMFVEDAEKMAPVWVEGVEKMATALANQTPGSDLSAELQEWANSMKAAAESAVSAPSSKEATTKKTEAPAPTPAPAHASALPALRDATTELATDEDAYSDWTEEDDEQETFYDDSKRQIPTEEEVIYVGWFAEEEPKGFTVVKRSTLRSLGSARKLKAYLAKALGKSGVKSALWWEPSSDVMDAPRWTEYRKGWIGEAMEGPEVQWIVDMAERFVLEEVEEDEEVKDVLEAEWSD